MEHLASRARPDSGRLSASSRRSPPPQVYVAASCAEGTQTANSGYTAQCQNVTTTQADIICASSADTVSQVVVDWLAFGPLA